MKAPADFNWLAPFYDRLARWVFGRRLEAAQVALLPLLPTTGRALMIGGGTGAQAAAFLRQCPLASLVFVESSSRMMALAQKRLAEFAKTDRIQFLLEDGTAFCQPQGFDLILTPFFLDVLGPGPLQRTLENLRLSLKPGGMWYLVDFEYPAKGLARIMGSALVWLMYRFFRWTCGIEARRLWPFHSLILAQGFSPLAEAISLKGLVMARLYRRET